MPRKKREGYKTLYIHVTAETKAKLDEIQRVCKLNNLNKWHCTQSQIFGVAIEELYKNRKRVYPLQ